MTKKTVTIHAILTTLSPLNIASPESFRYEINDNGYGVVKNGTKGGIACSGIQRRRFAPQSVDGLEYGVPFIAANNIAGRLRRHASKILLDAIKAKGQKITLSTYSAITCGAATGKPDSRDLTYAEYTESAKHPFVGLFGGGPRLLRRRMRVHDVLPVVEGLRAGGFSIAHPNGSGKATKGNNLTAAAAFKRGDDVSALLDVDRMQDTVEDFIEQLHQRQLLILGDKQAKDAEEKGNRNSTVTWSAVEFISPGVDFDFTIELVGVTDAQIGLFLLALDGLAKEQIGGQSRNGLGRIKLNDVAIAEVKSEGNSIVDGVFNNNVLVRTHSDVASYISAWEAEAMEITAEQLDAMMKPPVVDSADEKAEKAAVKKAAKLSKEA